MKVLRTPDERFEGLPDWNFETRYQSVPSGEGESLRVGYVDEGPRDAEVVLCMHGEPTWSYLYRKMIPIFTQAGLRTAAPDLIVMDIQLPGVSGLEITKTIKMDEELKGTPVIAVTAFAMKGDEEKIREAGCDAYISKPIAVPIFMETATKFPG